jgi:hypothetical protein
LNEVYTRERAEEDLKKEMSNFEPKETALIKIIAGLKEYFAIMLEMMDQRYMIKVPENMEMMKVMLFPGK